MNSTPICYRIDLIGMTSIAELHSRIKAAMQFPDYYGENWYAFWDCMTDLVGDPLNIEIIGVEWLQNRYPTEANVLFAYLKDIKHYADDRYTAITHITIVTGDTRTEIT